MYYIYIKQFSIDQKISNLYVLLKLRIKDSHGGSWSNYNYLWAGV